MTAFTCDHGEQYALFGSGGGERLAAELGVELLGQVPMEAAVSRGGDEGRPAAMSDGPAAAVFHAIAERIVTEVAPLMELTGCSARMLDAIERALDGAEAPAPTLS
jgi:ATP-binding protein involved in chromosome partitioning